MHTSFIRRGRALPGSARRLFQGAGTRTKCPQQQLGCVGCGGEVCAEPAGPPASPPWSPRVEEVAALPSCPQGWRERHPQMCASSLREFKAVFTSTAALTRNGWALPKADFPKNRLCVCVPHAFRGWRLCQGQGDRREAHSCSGQVEGFTFLQL